jgi:amino acid adenylation domain-containing protein
MVPVTQRISLTPAQQGMLAESLGAPSSGANIEQVIIRYDHNNPTAAEVLDAWRGAGQRFDTLRLSVASKPDQTFELWCKAEVLPEYREADWSEDPAPEQTLRAWLRADRKRGFDLVGGQGLWRLFYARISADAVVVVCTLHHVILDMNAMVSILEDVGARLSGVVPDASRDVPLTKLQKLISAQDMPAAEHFFADHLADFPGVNHFHPSLALPNPAPFAMGHIALELGAELRAHLTRRAAQAGATVANMVQLAYALVLARWTGQDSATLGLTQGGFPARRGLRHMAGCLLATLPLHQRLTADTLVDTQLQHLRDMSKALRQHHFTAPAQIRTACGLPGNERLFDAVLSVVPGALGDLLNGPHWQGRKVTVEEHGAAGLTLAVHLAPEMELVLEYSHSVLAPDHAARFLSHIHHALIALAQSDAGATLGQINSMPAPERQRLLAQALPEVPLPATTAPCIMARFAAIAAHRPNETALVCAQTGAELSYRTLADRANGLAQALRKRGVSEGAVIALDMPRSPAFVAAILGVLQTGAAFLPLDPALEPAQKAALIAQARATLVLGPGAGQLDPATLPPCTDAPDLPVPKADRMAYVIFTSGSTGTPKGVMGSCGALSAHADAVIAAYRLTPADRCLSFAGLGFDVALEEIIPTLVSGARLVLRTERAAQSLSDLRALVAEQGVTVLNLPASYWHVLVDDLGAGTMPACLRLMVTGSERINPQALARWQALCPQIGWINAYGPTEATITATAYNLPANAPVHPSATDVPIGRPLAHARAYVLAADGTLAPDGAEGTLWIGGPAVTLGYLDQPKISQTVFGPDPFLPGGRVYNTGDRAYWDAQGILHFVGRRDRQVKLRGFRIDLTGVERVLSDLPGVRRAHVALDGAGGPHARLLGWLLSESPEATLDLAVLRARVSRKLPSAAIPDLIQVQDMPVTANGKIATAALPRPAMPRPTADLDHDDPLIRQIATLMAQVLGLTEVGAQADFHDLGGDSLTAVRFAAMAEAALSRPITAMDLYRHPTPAGFADFLRHAADGPRYIVPIQPNGSKPAFFAVHVLGPRESQWRPMSEALGPDWPVYGISVGAPRSLEEIDIPSIAEKYFQDIQTYYPKGPLILGATSMASYYAYDLASRLVAAGRDVRLMVAFDAMGPGGRPSRKGLDKLRAHLRQFARHGLGHLRAIAASRAMQRQIERDGQKSPEGEVTGFNIIEATVAAVERYEPRLYPAPMLVFRADVSFWDSQQSLDTALGWSCVAQGGVQMIDVPGEHLSILERGNVETLARRLQEVIAQQDRD